MNLYETFVRKYDGVKEERNPDPEDWSPRRYFKADEDDIEAKINAIALKIESPSRSQVSNSNQYFWFENNSLSSVIIDEPQYDNPRKKDQNPSYQRNVHIKTMGVLGPTKLEKLLFDEGFRRAEK
ncbi:hypothetical protein HOD75_02505 [archaeon]|jgi:hypothetical protein|nr:hypothetical protein [archaeon]MBT4241750.1 hypothetical protein [archaeon]MBT4418298.1 hypothetical protein [archaeon]